MMGIQEEAGWREARINALSQELWGMGLTVIDRAPPEKMFDLAAGLAPAGMAYQWDALENAPRVGWKCVPASRHPGIFMPYGYTGDIEVEGLWLMERPKAEVDAFHAAAQAKACQNMADWFDRQGAQGFTGGVTVLSEGSQGRSTDIRTVGEKTLESVIEIPRELAPYIAHIFEERDRLWAGASDWWDKPTAEYLAYGELAAQNPDWTRGQLMNAVLTPIAIENIRKRLATEGAGHDQRADSQQPIEGDAGEDGGTAGPAQEGGPPEAG